MTEREPSPTKVDDEDGILTPTIPIIENNQQELDKALSSESM